MSKPINQYVTDLFHKLREDISAIKHRLFTEHPQQESKPSDAPKEYVINAIQKDDDSSNKRDDSEAIVRATLNMPQSIRVEAETSERQKKWYKDRMFLVQVAAVAAASVYALITYRQWKDSGTNFRTDQRAWLEVKEIKGIGLPGDPTAVLLQGHANVPYSFVVENIGKTIATNVRSQSGFSFGTEPRIPFPTFEQSVNTASYQVLFPNLELESSSPGPIVFWNRVAPDIPDDMAWIAGRRHLYLYIFIEYYDAFKPSVKHHTNVCAVWNSATSKQLFCHTGNTAD